MTGGSSTQIVLLVEGDGDRIAVPELVRQVAAEKKLFGLQTTSHPIKCGGIPRLQRPGELERFIRYACMRQDGQGVLLVLDCDDHCPREEARGFAPRIAPIAQRCEKRVGVAFLRSEFESLFLFSLPSIHQRFAKPTWTLDRIDLDADFEARRGAKELLDRCMGQQAYKETRDQVRFVTALDHELLGGRSRSYRHFVSTLEWLARPASKGGSSVYPVPEDP